MQDSRVHEDVARLEVWVVRPGAGVGDVTATGKAIILGENIDIGYLADIGTLAVFWDGRDIVHAETGAVV